VYELSVHDHQLWGVLVAHQVSRVGEKEKIEREDRKADERRRQRVEVERRNTQFPQHRTVGRGCGHRGNHHTSRFRFTTDERSNKHDLRFQFQIAQTLSIFIKTFRIEYFFLFVYKNVIVISNKLIVNDRFWPRLEKNFLRYDGFNGVLHISVGFLLQQSQRLLHFRFFAKHQMVSHYQNCRSRLSEMQVAD
jgi:hypothetical protein